MPKQLLLLPFLFLSYFINGQQNYIELRDYVTDSAKIFTSGQATALNEKLRDFEETSTNQIVVLTIDRLGFETIEAYANGVFNQNGIGQQGKDNGLLIVFSKMDREVRLEVGYGLEAYITDAVASRIIRNTMIPKFKEEAYFEGMDNAVDELIKYLNNPQALEEFKKDIAKSEKNNKIYGYIFLFGFLAIFIGVGGFFFYKSYRSVIEVFRGVFVGKLGVLPGVFMLFGSSFSSLFGLVFIAIPLLIGYTGFFSDESIFEGIVANPKILFWLALPFFGIAALIAFIKLKIKGDKDIQISWVKSDNNYVRKTFSSSGTHSFGRGSSGGSSSSFSGGGGSSGGGGASGSW